MKSGAICESSGAAIVALAIAERADMLDCGVTSVSDESFALGLRSM